MIFCVCFGYDEETCNMQRNGICREVQLLTLSVITMLPEGIPGT